MGLRTLRDSEIVRGIAAFLLVFALFTNGLLPVGWMPGKVSTDGHVGLVICSASDMNGVIFGEGHPEKPKSKQDGQVHKSCSHSANTSLLNIYVGVAETFNPSLVSQIGGLPVEPVLVLKWNAGLPLGSRAPPPHA